MLTVLIEAGEDQSALAATLATLVNGAVEGIIREVVVIDAGLDPATRKVADHAGCRIASKAGLPATVAGTRGDWLMLLEPGARLASDWVEAVSLHVAAAESGVRTPKAAGFSRSARDRPRFWERIGRRKTALSDGLLLPKAQGQGVAARSTSLEDMARGLATTRLDATIRPRITPTKKG